MVVVHHDAPTDVRSHAAHWVHEQRSGHFEDGHACPSTRTRSRNMAAIRRSDARPEKALRSALHATGLRFRKDYRLDLGRVKPRPDIVFTRAKVAVFVDGCCLALVPPHRVQPKTNTDFWTPKLARNVERDREQDRALRNAG